MAATVLSATLGGGPDAVVIAVIVVFAILLGFVQGAGRRALGALQRMAAPTAKVLRDGRESTIPAGGGLPADLVRLGTGYRIPADLRLIKAVNVRGDVGR